jgi:uncharacterized secreted protein with C-terminal beta-propeller domain
MSNSKFDTKAARVIASQLYVCKGLKRNPAKMIKFIQTNRDYFPNFSDEHLILIKQEHNLTDDDINKQEDVQFADIKAEEKFEKELMEKAEKIETIRKEQKRDHRGKGETTIYTSINTEKTKDSMELEP